MTRPKVKTPSERVRRNFQAYLAATRYDLVTFTHPLAAAGSILLRPEILKRLNFCSCQSAYI